MDSNHELSVHRTDALTVELDVLGSLATMTDSPLLICNPDQPGWLHAEHSVTSIATAPWCQHKIKVSPGGVHALLTRPGLLTCCWTCMPPDIDKSQWAVLPEIKANFEAETGEELTPAFAEELRQLGLAQGRRNRNRRR